MSKRVFRSHESKVIAGVCGGLGEYFDIDPAWVRILFVLTIFANGLGLLAYAICWIVIPARPLPIPGAAGTTADAAPANSAVGVGAPPNNGRRHGVGFWPGLILIALGMVFLARHVFFWFDFDLIWPLLLIGLGVALIVRGLDPNKRQESDTVYDQTNKEVANESR